VGYDCDPTRVLGTCLTRNTILDGRVFRIMVSSEHLTGSLCASCLGLQLEKRSGISRRIVAVYQLYTARDASHMLEIWRLSSEEVGLTHNGSRPNFPNRLGACVLSLAASTLFPHCVRCMEVAPTTTNEAGGTPDFGDLCRAVALY
jgi:hypothetical protein